MLSLVRNRLPELVLLANAGAFAVLFAELLLMEHTDGIQRVAPVATASGVVLCLLAVVLPSRLKYVAVFMLVMLSVTGVIGFARHLDERGGIALSSLTSDEEDDDSRGRGRGRSGEGGGGEDDDDSEPPPLAPLSISGTALLSALAAVAATRSVRD